MLVFPVAIVLVHSSGYGQDLEKFTSLNSKYRLSDLKSISKTSQQMQDNLSQRRPLENDNVVDETRYLIGGGDRFFITFLDQTALAYYGNVNPQGDLYVPELGLFKLGKIPLAEAKRRILEDLKKRYRNADSIYISLHTPKKATVYLRGPIKNPGRIELPGTMRLLDAVKIACDLDLTLMRELDSRSILCSSPDTAIYYDVYKYMLTGDLSENPYLYPGDHIAIQGTTRRVMVSGAVNGLAKGIMPIKENETVASLLSIFEFDASADTTFVILKRPTAERGETITKIPSSSFTDQKIHDRDVITVPVMKNPPEMMIVTVEGDVERPGIYPSCKHGTTAREILDLAVVLPTASRRRIAVLRTEKELPLPVNPQERSMVATSLPQSFTRSEMNNAISLMMTAKDYTVIPLFKTDDIELENNDKIVVPKSESLVYISGAVEQPGGYPFNEGKPVSYYIKQAGGFNKLADRQNIYSVIKYDEVMQFCNQGDVQDGDIIVVPFSKENKFFTNIFLPTFQIIATSITLLVAIIPLVK